MKIRNLTPHSVTIVTNNGTITLQPDGPAPRLAVTRQFVGTVDIDGQAVTINRPTLGETQGLPPAEDNTLLLVSALVAEANKGRADLFSPGELVRDATGVIVGCRGLCCYHSS